MEESRPRPMYQEVLHQVLRLEAEDQLQLLQILVDIVLPKVTIGPRRSFLELEGLGKEVWEGVDVAKYIEEERKSWE